MVVTGQYLLWCLRSRILCKVVLIVMITKEKQIEKYIIEDMNMTPSKMLVSLIVYPSRLQQLNNTALRNIVIEYAPIYKKYRLLLDTTSWELDFITWFGFVLRQRIVNKPELIRILESE